MAKTQIGTVLYNSVAEIEARTGFPQNETYNIELKSTDPSVPDLTYNQKNDTDLPNDGYICIHSPNDGLGNGVKWVLQGAKKTGTFTLEYNGLLEDNTQVTVVDIPALGVLLNKDYVFSRIDESSTQEVDVVEKPIVTDDGYVKIKIKNVSGNNLLSVGIVFNWVELRN